MFGVGNGVVVLEVEDVFGARNDVDGDELLLYILFEAWLLGVSLVSPMASKLPLEAKEPSFDFGMCMGFLPKVVAPTSFLFIYVA